jgi:hypothetical protein
MDRTSLNLVSIVLGGAGLMTVLTGFNVPQTRMAFTGENLYLLKREAIVDAMTWIFTGLALIGLLIQVAAEIAGNSLPERRYTTGSYVCVTGISIVIACGLIPVLTRIGKVIARRRWRPLILEKKRNEVERAAYAVAHDGLFSEHQGSLPEKIEATGQQDLAQVDDETRGPTRTEAAHRS